jgi:hypothetical protein
MESALRSPWISATLNLRGRFHSHYLPSRPHSERLHHLTPRWGRSFSYPRRLMAPHPAGTAMEGGHPERCEICGRHRDELRGADSKLCYSDVHQKYTCLRCHFAGSSGASNMRQCSQCGHLFRQVDRELRCEECREPQLTLLGE